MEESWSWSLLLLAMAMLVSRSVAQDTSCQSQLVPCLNYLNSTTTPPSSYCDPLKSVIKSDEQCLCNLLSSRSTSINVAKAMQLLAKCGENINATACTTGSPTTKTVVPNSASKDLACHVMLVAVLAVFLQISVSSTTLLGD